MGRTNQTLKLEVAYRRLLSKLEQDRQNRPDIPDAPTPVQATYTCEYCHDVGFVKLEVPVDDPRFGKAFDCKECAPARKAARRAEEMDRFMTGVSGIPKNMRYRTFADFDALPEHIRAGKEETAAICKMLGTGKAFADPDDPRLLYTGVFVYGPNGTAKTTLVTCALKERAAAGVGVLWVDMINLLGGLRDMINARKQDADAPTVQQLIDSMIYARVLLLDEFGQKRGFNVTPFAREQIYRIINERLAKNRPTFVTSNLSPDDIYDQFGGSIHRRLTELCYTVECTGLNPRTGK